MIVSASSVGAVVSTPAQVLQSARDWRTAVTDLVDWMVGQGRCFSSGEIVAYIRAYRSDIRCAATAVGEFIRDQYDQGFFPSYDGVTYPTQVPRVTTGTSITLDGRTVRSKTPAGVSVFVYAPDQTEGAAHDFEVFIPDWDDPTAQRALPVGVIPTQPAPVLTPASAVGHTVMTALVRPDRRLQVPRGAFDAMVAISGQAFRGGRNGDPVYITFQGTDIRVTRAPVDTSSTMHYLWEQRGRMAFVRPQAPFNPGDRFAISLVGSDLVVDTSVTV